MEDQAPRELQETAVEEHATPEEEFVPTVSERIIDLFTAPKRAFEKENIAGDHGLQIVTGLLIYIVLSVIGTYVMMSNPELQQMMLENQMSTGDAEEVMRQQQTMGGAMVIFSAIGMSVAAALSLVIGAFILFLIAKALEQSRESRVRYVPAMSVTALSMIIIGLATLIQFILTSIANAPVSLGLDALIGGTEPGEFSVLSLINPLYIWWVIAAGYGVMHLSGASAGKSIGVVAVVTIILGAIIGWVGAAVRSAFMM